MSQGHKGIQKNSKNEQQKLYLAAKEEQEKSLFRMTQEAQDEADIEKYRFFRARILKERQGKEVHVPAPPLKALVFKGGGAKGGAYPGVFKALEEQGFDDEVDTVIGASAGAITAFIIGLGFTAEQVKVFFENFNFLDFTDIKPDGWAAFFNGNGAGNLMDFLQYGFVYTGEGFHDWASFMVEQILGSPNATFADLHNARMLDPTLKEMVFKATRYNARPGDVVEQTFSYLETPHVRIADAVRASMAFPGAFSPHTVREKNGKIVGVFADGGIINNYPIEEASRDEYQHPNYKPIEKFDKDRKPHKINPCVVGLNLVSNVAKLDEKITPLTPRLRKLRAQKIALEKKNKSKKNEDVEEINGEWRFNDILNAILWNKIGRPVREHVSQKQALYDDQCVQIWTEDVGTLEFNAPKRKIERLFEGGKNAMRLWLKRNKDPSVPYAYPDQFDDRPTNADKLLKQSNPEHYYLQKLTDYYIELMSEMRKMEIQHNNTDAKILKNVKIQYLSHKIEEAMNDMRKRPHLNPQAIEKKAFQEASKKVKDRKKYLQEQRQRRDFIIKDDVLIQNIAEKLIKHPQEGLRMLKGQLSKVIPLLRTHHGGNLLSIAVQIGNPAIAREVFNIVQNASAQCYYQGRKEDIKYSLAQMLNEFAKPSIFSVLAGHGNVAMLGLVLRHGADPLFRHPYSNTTGLQDILDASDFESFKGVIKYFLARGMDVKNIRISADMSIGHYILNYANTDFIKKLMNDKSLAKQVLNFHMKDANYNNLVQEAARFSSTQEDVRWQLVKAYSPKQNVHFDNVKTQAEQNHAIHQQKKNQADRHFEEILKSPNSQAIISSTSPYVCLQILNSYIRSKGIIRYCELVNDKAYADIFIQLCERIYTNRTTRKQLKQLLDKKVNGKTALYMAAQAGNTKVVSYLRQSKYDCDINNAGPINQPCALLIAAKNGHSETVSALMKSIPYGMRVGYHSVSRRKPDYEENKTPLHYLAMLGTPQAFCDVLFGGGMRSEPSKVALMKDKSGKTPFMYLVEHNRLDIFEEILKRGKGARKGLLWNNDYLFAAVFGWHFDSKEGYADLERAKEINPKLYEFISEHLSKNKAKAAHIKQEVDSQVKAAKENRTSHVMQTMQELAKMELSKVAGNELEDWVKVPMRSRQSGPTRVKERAYFFEAQIHKNEQQDKSVIQKNKQKPESPKNSPGNGAKKVPKK